MWKNRNWSSKAASIQQLSDLWTRSADAEPHPLHSIYPPLPTEKQSKKHVVSTAQSTDEFQQPKYVMKHRHGVDFTDMTYQLDAKLNVTILKEWCVELEMSLLKSTVQCTLDVTEKKLFLSSVKPAKYRLDIDLPYPVDDKRGSAKIDVESRKMKIFLPMKTTDRSKKFRRQEPRTQSTMLSMFKAER